MQTLSEPVSDRSDPFVQTQWSVVLAAGRSQIDPEIAHAALAQLCQTYWPPLYAFVRSRGYSLHDAQDLTQSFFEHLIEHKIYARADRQKGRFRSFLLASLKNFLANAHDREQTLKRGGGQNFLPLHEQQAKEAEFLFQTHGASNNEIATDRLFERSWADTLVMRSSPNSRQLTRRRARIACLRNFEPSSQWTNRCPATSSLLLVSTFQHQLFGAMSHVCGRIIVKRCGQRCAEL
ncbi:MAG: sigma-70 family RNA polymerase sigma factor [Chthoniobacterales bacterium]|nr:sigma-70 family RNA polymerase sigma factor [Chthoniobacterales bacterium]